MKLLTLYQDAKSNLQKAVTNDERKFWMVVIDSITFQIERQAENLATN